MPQERMERIAKALGTVRCSAVSPESELHRQAAEALALAGLSVQHEAVLGPRCRIDFLVDGIGIEIKKSRPVRAKLIAQLSRYAACGNVDGLVVVAPRGVDLPQQIGGKRVRMIALERLWGISLP